MPRISGSPPVAPTGQDFFGPAPKPPSDDPTPLIGPLGVALAFLLLAFVGAFAGMWWLGVGQPSSPAPVPQVQAPARPPWNPGSGPLVDGLPLPGEPPSVMHWSPDGRQIGWIEFDAQRSRRVAVVVPVRERFGEPEQLEEQPDWLARPVPASGLTATIREGVVVLQGGPEGVSAIVDLFGQLGLNEPRAPSLYERNGRVWLAVVGHKGAPGAPMSLHVVEVTSLLR